MALSAGASMLADTLPTNYEYYTSGGISSGLSVDQPYFTLNDKNVTLYSGAMHYFRVPRAYWRDRLRKMRAAGLNTVETYVPWHLHEYQSGKYDFGDGGSDFQDFLNVTEFVRIAQEEDLFVLARSGPYIASEVDAGGFPSWLLREGVKARTSDATYMKYVTRFFNVLMPILAALQFTKGGPIIAFQVENEYAYTHYGDMDYLRALRQNMLDNGIVELLFTSDGPSMGTQGTIPELFFMTGNFQPTQPTWALDKMKELQPNKPVMSMEFYTGGSMRWGVDHTGVPSTDTFADGYETVLNYSASLNVYMFHGGTSFGFLSGGYGSSAAFSPRVTSYDFDGVITESGEYSEKYTRVKELISKYSYVKTKIPDVPEVPAKIAYPSLPIQGQIPIDEALETIESVFSEELISMEHLDINDNSGQSFGYVVYRQSNLNIEANSALLIEGRVCDTLMVLINGQLVSPILNNTEDLDKYGTWRTENSTLTLTTEDLTGATLDLIVENAGRLVGGSEPYKGLFQGQAMINDDVLSNWEIFPLEFKTSWTNSLTNWGSVNLDTVGPSLYKTVLEIEDDPEDTFVYMENWTKGIVIINGFVLGRYSHMGPLQTLYLPGPFLKKGSNDVVIFEHFHPGTEVAFSTEHVYILH